jgi:hypothetical protein
MEDNLVVEQCSTIAQGRPTDLVPVEAETLPTEDKEVEEQIVTAEVQELPVEEAVTNSEACVDNMRQTIEEMQASSLVNSCASSKKKRTLAEITGGLNEENP